MTRAIVEHNFFPLERAANLQRSSIRGIQSGIARMNPDLVRSVMDNSRPPPVWTGAGPNRILTPSAPVLARSPSTLTMVNEGPPGTAPLTIFHNGTLTIFRVGPAEAEAVMKAAAKWTECVKEKWTDCVKEGILDKHTGDLPLARKKSLQRFLEKRKERLTAMAPPSPQEGDVEGGSGKKARMELRWMVINP